MKLRTDQASIQYSVPVSQAATNPDEQAIYRYAACFSLNVFPPHNPEKPNPARTKAFSAPSNPANTLILKPSIAAPAAGSLTHKRPSPTASKWVTRSVLPAPSFSSPEMAAEMAEMYWLSLVRDIPFRDYANLPLTQQAAQELKATTKSTFRIAAPGVTDGPYISQFLSKPVPMNSTWVDQRYRVPLPQNDFMEGFAEWLQVQGGVPPGATISGTLLLATSATAATLPNSSITTIFINLSSTLRSF